MKIEERWETGDRMRSDDKSLNKGNKTKKGGNTIKRIVVKNLRDLEGMSSKKSKVTGRLSLDKG